MNTTTTTTPDRPLRADARRNREKVVTAAEAAFAEYGLEAQMDDIARRAEVGVGTLYRHFPTKDALVRAIVVKQMGESAALGRGLLGRDDGEPWEAFASFFRTAGLKDQALAPVMSTQPRETFIEAAVETGLVEVAEELLRRAQEAGVARPDARVDDVPLTMCGLGAVLRHWDADAGRRFIELVLDGFRAGAPSGELPDYRILNRG